MLVPLAILVLGVAVVSYGALRDRTRRQEDQARLSAPPDRVIPGLAPQATAPRYLDPVAARLPISPDRDRLDDQEQRAVDDALAARDPLLDSGWLRPGFAAQNDDGRAVLGDASVIVVDGPISDTRHAVALLDLTRRSHRGLVIVADGFSDAVAEVLEINTQRGAVDVVAVRTDRAGRETVLAAAGGQAVELTDLQAGYLPAEHLGRAGRWVSTRDHSWLLDPADTSVDVADADGDDTLS